MEKQQTIFDLKRELKAQDLQDIQLEIAKQDLKIKKMQSKAIVYGLGFGLLGAIGVCVKLLSMILDLVKGP